MLAMNIVTVRGPTHLFLQATQFKGIVTLQTMYTLRMISMMRY